MRYSQLFGKTLNQPPKEAETISHKLLTQAGLIDRQLAAGIYTYLPLGWRVFKKIEQIIREEMNAIGGQELLMPALQPKELWEKSDRWDYYDPPLFKFKDRHEKYLTIGPTHEEVITDLVARFIKSYKDLPLALYHIQDKFRNEMRATSGLLRVREFFMKDLYSFHSDQKDLDKFYLRVSGAYKKIFARCGFETKMVEASSGSIGGNFCHEFMNLCTAGEDKIVCCKKCDWAVSAEKIQNEKIIINNCPKCGGAVETLRAIENGHIFQLKTKYTEKLNAFYIDKKGNKKVITSGCYGIGLGRLMATVVEAHHDQKGIIWPKSVAPYQAHLMNISNTTNKQISKYTNEVYKKLENAGIEVLYDDREEGLPAGRQVSAGVKFADADLIGIPVRLVVSEKTGNKVEWKDRSQSQTELLSLDSVIKKLSAQKGG
jgi:prolyl-tRNA synthetase